VSNRRTLMAAAAIVLAAVAGIGVYMYASNADKRAQDKVHFVDALVATTDIAKGTTGQEALQAGLIQREKVARGSVPPLIVTNVNDLVSKVAAARIDTKQFITAQTFVSAGEGVGGKFAQAIAKEDLVAVSLNVDPERGVANQIAPGDHVDIATTATDQNGVSSTTWFLRDVKVLAVGAVTTLQPAAPAADGTTAQPTVQSGLLTFEVTSDDALRVIAANTGGGKLYLVLLPPKVGTTSGGTASPASGSR
jgi:Flp pilus assembly protein CpaB